MKRSLPPSSSRAFDLGRSRDALLPDARAAAAGRSLLDRPRGGGGGSGRPVDVYVRAAPSSRDDNEASRPAFPPSSSPTSDAAEPSAELALRRVSLAPSSEEVDARTTSVAASVSSLSLRSARASAASSGGGRRNPRLKPTTSERKNEEFDLTSQATRGRRSAEVLWKASAEELWKSSALQNVATKPRPKSGRETRAGAELFFGRPQPSLFEHIVKA
ncbi:hypothetical protein ACHAWF_010010 [Thalassiosira exigua]